MDVKCLGRNTTRKSTMSRLEADWIDVALASTSLAVAAKYLLASGSNGIALVSYLAVTLGTAVVLFLRVRNKRTQR